MLGNRALLFNELAEDSQCHLTNLSHSCMDTIFRFSVLCAIVARYKQRHTKLL